ncbi:MAG: hypothetical protein PUD65_05260, partial [Spirochaetales bacterium]|nr:hypothetical protein [Spirochaetales bacterium]
NGESNDPDKVGTGKFINAYRTGDGRNNPISVTIENCQFITTCTKSYQAICLKGENNNAWNVFIKDSSITVNGKKYGSFETSESVKYKSVRNSSLYDLKDPNNNTIVRIVDTQSGVDKVVWEKSAMVSIN